MSDKILEVAGTRPSNIRGLLPEIELKDMTPLLPPSPTVVEEPTVGMGFPVEEPIFNPTTIGEYNTGAFDITVQSTGLSPDHFLFTITSRFPGNPGFLSVILSSNDLSYINRMIDEHKNKGKTS